MGNAARLTLVTGVVAIIAIAPVTSGATKEILIAVIFSVVVTTAMMIVAGDPDKNDEEGERD